MMSLAARAGRFSKGLLRRACSASRPSFSLMDEAPVAGGLAISGLLDLEPIRLSYLNDAARSEG